MIVATMVFGAIVAGLVQWFWLRKTIAGLRQEVRRLQESPDSHEWLCACGHFEESQFDCRRCGGEPPWGCMDDSCSRHHPEERDEDWEPSEDDEFLMGDPGRKCRVCGCTDEDCQGCIERTGKPCHWVAPDLCSACVEGLSVRQAIDLFTRPAP